MANSITKEVADFKNFVLHLKLEAVALALLMVALTYKSPYSLWWLLIGFPVVDVCMVGYAFGNRVGSIAYNLLHNATFPTLLVTIGVIADRPEISIVGFVWTFHTAIDRVLGYGLKHGHSFHATHLGAIQKPGQKKQ